MKHSKLKLTKKIVLTAFILFNKIAYTYSQSGGFGGVERKVNELYTSFRSIAIIIAALAALGGGVVTAFKMKNAEGGEGKKALFSYIGGLIFLIVMLFVVDNVIKNMR